MFLFHLRLISNVYNFIRAQCLTFGVISILWKNQNHMWVFFKAQLSCHQGERKKVHIYLYILTHTQTYKSIFINITTILHFGCIKTAPKHQSKNLPAKTDSKKDLINYQRRRSRETATKDLISWSNQGSGHGIPDSFLGYGRNSNSSVRYHYRYQCLLHPFSPGKRWRSLVTSSQQSGIKRAFLRIFRSLTVLLYQL